MKRLTVGVRSVPFFSFLGTKGRDNETCVGGKGFQPLNRICTDSADLDSFILTSFSPVCQPPTVNEPCNIAGVSCGRQVFPPHFASNVNDRVSPCMRRIGDGVPFK